MKDIKTLLEILLDQYKSNRIEGIQSMGLCRTIGVLQESRLITEYEANELDYHLDENRPESSIGKIYWWPEGEVEPRIEFLKQLIMKYETQCQSK